MSSPSTDGVPAFSEPPDVSALNRFRRYQKSCAAPPAVTDLFMALTVGGHPKKCRWDSRSFPKSSTASRKVHSTATGKTRLNKLKWDAVKILIFCTVYCSFSRGWFLMFKTSQGLIIKRFEAKLVSLLVL